MPTFIILAIIFILAALMSGCQTTTTTAANATAQPDANTAAKKEDPKPADPILIGNMSSDPAMSPSLATPTEAYKTAYELRKKKDVQGLKSIMSEDIKEFLTMMGEAEQKSLDEVVKDMCEKPQADRAESRNEKITGNRAELEYLTETGSWKTMDFEKVDGKWLLTFPKASNESMK